jgi:hypothetical protein
MLKTKYSQCGNQNPGLLLKARGSLNCIQNILLLARSSTIDSSHDYPIDKMIEDPTGQMDQVVS